VAAYYNEHDPRAAAWLRELIRDGLIADGEVDERSIESVEASDLAGFVQAHFFAGIGGWSYALRLAGWPDDRPAWSGSCPCQPFSAAGKADGADDSRHLWPAWFELIAECRPPVVFGEQVASVDGLAWLDLVYADLEGSGYAVGAVDLCAAGVGAPHLRQRIWFVADAYGRRLKVQRVEEPQKGLEGARGAEPDGHRADRGQHDATDGGLGDTHSKREGASGGIQEGPQPEPARGFWDDCDWLPAKGGGGGVGDTEGNRRTDQSDRSPDRTRRAPAEDSAKGRAGEPSDSSGPWRDYDWLPCRDGKARPTQPGLLPLAHGVSGRVGLLRGAGNAIVPQVAAEVIRAYMEVDL